MNIVRARLKPMGGATEFVSVKGRIKSLIEKNSGTIVSSVSKKLNFLIAGEKPTKRKIDSANELNIKIIDQNKLLEMLKMTS